MPGPLALPSLRIYAELRKKSAHIENVSLGVGGKMSLKYPYKGIDGQRDTGTVGSTVLVPSNSDR